MNAHTDDRRLLIEFGNGYNWKLCKVVRTNKDCVLGKHYHKIKKESFMLVKGRGKIKIGNMNFIKIQLFKEYFVPINVVHEFNLEKDSILIGLCSEEFSSSDDFEIS